KGEHGKPYPLTEEDRDDLAYRENGFNIFVSNNIALERSLPDIRHSNCKHKMYLERLPNTSIIIPFHNEGWTSLLRTIHSIINRTPESLIEEIILVDDFSDRGAKDLCSQPKPDDSTVAVQMQPTIRLLVMDGTKLGSSLVPKAAFGGSILYGSSPFSAASITSLSSPVACSSSVGTPPPEAMERVATPPQGPAGPKGLHRQSAHSAK
ncbi:polypeptide N-acetylgalactosaminyltransferase-like 6, partial [Sigmodon hispidus]